MGPIDNPRVDDVWLFRMCAMSLKYYENLLTLEKRMHMIEIKECMGLYFYILPLSLKMAYKFILKVNYFNFDKVY